MSSDVLRHFRLLQSEFLGCMKLKDSAQGDVTHDVPPQVCKSHRSQNHPNFHQRVKTALQM